MRKIRKWERERETNSAASPITVISVTLPRYTDASGFLVAELGSNEGVDPRLAMKSNPEQIICAVTSTKSAWYPCQY